MDVRVLGTILGAAIILLAAMLAARAFLEINVFPNLQSPWLLVIPLLLLRKYAKRVGPVLIHVMRNVVGDIRRPPISQRVCDMNVGRVGIAPKKWTVS